MYLAQAFNATFSLPQMAANGLENITSPYKNCGTISDITNLRLVSGGVKCANVQSRLRAKKHARQLDYATLGLG
jgi:hypothetical protein